MTYKKWLVINPKTLKILKECDSLKNARMAMASATGRFNRDVCAVVEAEVNYNPRKPLFFDLYENGHIGNYKDQLSDINKFPKNILMEYDLKGIE